MPRKRDLKICEVVTGPSRNLRARLAGETLLCTVSWMQNHKVNLKAEKIFWHMRQASKNLGLSCHHHEDARQLVETQRSHSFWPIIIYHWDFYIFGFSTSGPRKLTF